jgi:hypothetical protein
MVNAWPYNNGKGVTMLDMLDILLSGEPIFNLGLNFEPCC